MKKGWLSMITASVLLYSIPNVLAHCPLCTAGAAAGIGISRYLGVNDSVVGLFAGAIIVSSALWFNKWLKKKIELPLQTLIVIFASFLLLVIPLYYAGTITGFAVVKALPEQYSIFGLGAFGIDKLLFGIILGTFATWFSFEFSDYIKKKRGKVLWNYQGLSFMVITLTLLSILLYIITKLNGKV